MSFLNFDEIVGWDVTMKMKMLAAVTDSETEVYYWPKSS